MDNNDYLLVDLPNQETLVEFTEDSKVNPNNWPIVCLDIPVIINKILNNSRILTIALDSLKRSTMESLHLLSSSIVGYPPLYLAMQSPLLCRISTCQAEVKKFCQQPFS